MTGGFLERFSDWIADESDRAAERQRRADNASLISQRMSELASNADDEDARSLAQALAEAFGSPEELS